MRTRIAIMAFCVTLASAAVTLAQSDFDELLGDSGSKLLASKANYGVSIPLRIAVNGDVGLDNETVQTLVGNPDVLLKSAREVDPKAKESLQPGEVVVSIDGLRLPCKVAYSPKVGGALSGLLMIDVGPPLEPPGKDKTYQELAESFREVARRLGVGVARNLEQSLTQIVQRQSERKQMRQARLEEQFARKAKELQVAIDQLSKERDAIGALPEAVLVQTIGDLSKRKQELELEQAGLEARNQTLELQINQSMKRTDEIAGQDEVVANFRRVVELQERRLQELQAVHAAGQASRDMLNQAEVGLASAKVELSQAMRATTAAGSQELQRLNAELAKTAVSTAECQAKLRFLSEQLQRNLEVWNLERTQGETLRAKISELRQLSSSLADELQKRELEAIPASVVDVSVYTFWNPEEVTPR